jgi:Zn-dependent protease
LLVLFLTLVVLINLFLLFFNIIPIHPLDGSKLVDALLTKPSQQPLRRAIATHGPRFLLFMVLFSLFTSYNIFFFISAPSYYVCDILSGGACTAFF